MGSRGSSCWTPRRASNGCTPRCSRPQRSVEPAPQNRSKESGQIWDHEEMNKLWRNYMKKWGQTDSSLKGIGIYWNLSKVRCKTNPSLTESMTNSRCMPVPMPTGPRFFCCFTPLKQGYGSVHWAFPGSLFLRSWLLLSAWEQLSNCGHATCCRPRIPPPLTAAAVQAIAPGRPAMLGPVSTPSSLA